MKENTVEITGFHAHVYFDKATRERAARVREGLGRFHVRLGGWHDGPVGPHTKAMYLAAFPPQEFGRVVPWLMLNREGLDVLVHPETGDNLKDHLDHSLWLGERLELKVDHLRRARAT